MLLHVLEGHSGQEGIRKVFFYAEDMKQAHKLAIQLYDEIHEGYIKLEKDMEEYNANMRDAAKVVEKEAARIDIHIKAANAGLSNAVVKHGPFTPEWNNALAKVNNLKAQKRALRVEDYKMPHHKDEELYYIIKHTIGFYEDKDRCVEEWCFQVQQHKVGELL